MSFFQTLKKKEDTQGNFKDFSNSDARYVCSSIGTVRCTHTKKNLLQLLITTVYISILTVSIITDHRFKSIIVRYKKNSFMTIANVQLA